ncbi:Rv3654c family TadE-like protein [Streptomyces eurythermus]|uniref:Rv3654c family TadE-like protein n=1 Tax=Streptomyces eurythermus TaxID=42237 RepID=UPI0036819C2A
MTSRWLGFGRGRRAPVPGRLRAGVARGCGSDRGSATVWSLGAMALLCAVFGAVLFYGQAVAVRHQAAGGADLAALAAADHWAEGGTAACARAGRLAEAQGVRLVRCAIVGDISDVTAAAGRGPFAAEVRARAGPPGPVPPGTPDGVRAVSPAGSGASGLVPPGVPGGLRAVPPAEPGVPPGPPSP